MLSAAADDEVAANPIAKLGCALGLTRSKTDHRTPAGSIFSKDSSRHWSGLLRDLRPDIALLAAVRRGECRWGAGVAGSYEVGRAGLEPATRCLKDPTGDDQGTLSDCFLDEVE